MLLIGRWLARVRRQTTPVSNCRSDIELEALTKAHGAMLALLAVILEREDVIASEDFAQSLAAFATVTAADRPDVAEILARWAAGVSEAASTLSDPPMFQ